MNGNALPWVKSAMLAVPCSKPGRSAPSFTPAQRALTMGVWMYEDGDYVGAESYLKIARTEPRRISVSKPPIDWWKREGHAS